jgi:protein-tyrosine phosphatase
MTDTNLVGLASEIIPGLFQGRCPKTAADLRAYMVEKITASVGLSPGAAMDADFLPGELKMMWPIGDDSWLPSGSIIRAIAAMVSMLLDDGHKVLVCCDAGMNRSGLVVARTLIHRGMPPERAVALIRERRDPAALSNAAFVKWLLQEAE